MRSRLCAVGRGEWLQAQERAGVTLHSAGGGWEIAKEGGKARHVICMEDDDVWGMR